MTIKEIIDHNRWLGQRTLNGEYDWQAHNISLDHIQAQLEKECDVVLEQSNKRIAELESVLLEVDECAFYWSEYDVPIGLPERIKRVLENSEEH